MNRFSITHAAVRIGTLIKRIARAAPVVLVLATSLQADEYAFVVTTDYYSAAYYSTIEIAPPRTADVSIAPVSSDPLAHYDVEEDMIFVINRYLADNIQIVEPGQGFSTIGQYSVGNGSNPHDIRLASDTKAYVSRYEWKTLLIVHPYTGDSLGTIDLSPLADADGIPEMDRMEIVGDRLFVTLNNIDRFTWLPAGAGKIAVIDTETDTLVDCDPLIPGIQPIVLALPNPYSELRYDRCRGELVVGCLGAWGVMDGGIETVNPVTLKSNGVVITETELGGDIYDGLFAPDGKGYAVVLDPAPWPDNYGRLVAFDRATRVVTDTLHRQTSGMGASLATIELNRQRELYLCDRDLTQPGIRIFDTVGDSLITFRDVGIPPFDIAFIQAPMAGTEPIPQPDPDTRTLVARTYPNPFRQATNIVFTVPGEDSATRVRLSVYDPRGRLVSILVDCSMPAGTHVAHWDGRDGYGKPVAGGVYFCSISVDGRRRTFPLIATR
ncbi:MAG: FlgD immunoglobulin-like domain containing protein [Candidatus Eisenbacteria bacterium]